MSGYISVIVGSDVPEVTRLLLAKGTQEITIKFAGGFTLRLLSTPELALATARALAEPYNAIADAELDRQMCEDYEAREEAAAIQTMQLDEPVRPTPPPCGWPKSEEELDALDAEKGL